MVVESRENPLLLLLQLCFEPAMKRTKSRGSSSSSSGKGSKSEPAAKKRGTLTDRTALKWVDEDIQSSDSEDESRNVPGAGDAEESDEDGDETAEQRRKRLLPRHTYRIVIFFVLLTFITYCIHLNI